MSLVAIVAGLLSVESISLAQDCPGGIPCVGIDGAECEYTNFNDAYADAIRGVRVKPAIIEVGEADGLLLDREISVTGANDDCTAEAGPQDPHAIFSNPEGGRIFQIIPGIEHSRFSIRIAHLTLVDGDAVFGGLVLADGSGQLDDVVVWMDDVIMYGGIAHFGVGGCVDAFGVDILKFSDSTIENCSATTFEGAGSGGAISMLGGSLWLHNTTIDDAFAEFQGGGIFASDALVQLSGTSTIENVTSGEGGAIFAERSSVLMFNSSSISDAHAQVGGGIWAGDQSWIEMVDESAIFDCDATDGGAVALIGEGNVWNTKPHLGMAEEAAIHDSEAVDGGGVFAVAAEIELRGAEIYQNQATGDGGGIYAASQSFLDSESTHILLWDGAQITQNSAVDGGGIMLRAGFTPGFLDIPGAVEFAGNDASGDGGAVYLSSSDMEIWPDTGQRAWFTNNHAGSDGGALVVNGSTLIAHGFGEILFGATVDPVTGVAEPLEGNTAVDEGGALYVKDALVTTAVVTVTGIPTWWIPDPPSPVDCADLATAPCLTAGGLRFVGNSANHAGTTGPKGGAIRLVGAHMVARALVVEQNTADGAGVQRGAGGGLAISGPSSVQLEDSTVSRNVADVGGGLHVSNGATVSLLTRYDLAAPEVECGEATLGFQGPMDVESDRYCAELSFNTARTGGGALVDDASLHLTYAAVVANQTTSNGAALKYQGTSDALLWSVLLAYNESSTTDNGVRFSSSTTVDVDGTTFADALEVRFAAGTASTAVYNSLAWHDDFATENRDILVTPGGSVQGGCNAGLGVDNLIGSGNLEGQDPLFDSYHVRTDFFPMAPPVIDVCGSGPDFGLFGTARAAGAGFDMGSFEQ